METYGRVRSGEVAGSLTAQTLPDVACVLVKVAAPSTNTAAVYLGGHGVTRPDGVSDATTGLALAPGANSGWMRIANLNLLAIICENANDGVLYLALG
jgi:hypothetical protein